jgi:hypothetical protein
LDRLDQVKRVIESKMAKRTEILIAKGIIGFEIKASPLKIYES